MVDMENEHPQCSAAATDGADAASNVAAVPIHDEWIEPAPDAGRGRPHVPPLLNDSLVKTIRGLVRGAFAQQVVVVEDADSPAAAAPAEPPVHILPMPEGDSTPTPADLDPPRRPAFPGRKKHHAWKRAASFAALEQADTHHRLGGQRHFVRRSADDTFIEDFPAESGTLLPDDVRDQFRESLGMLENALADPVLTSIIASVMITLIILSFIVGRASGVSAAATSRRDAKLAAAAGGRAGASAPPTMKCCRNPMCLPLKLCWRAVCGPKKKPTLGPRSRYGTRSGAGASAAAGSVCDCPMKLETGTHAKSCAVHNMSSTLCPDTEAYMYDSELDSDYSDDDY
ncbi:hypothetical protein H696_01969 [Fonticula alba]|uniref:Uncharacterized protein n=1 Tax=Fonticula alba TaxID=691883 RepID=A0A058ZAS5_FONAL|nr:hypothetical protein H696_01969 [Fonticula alba]KCV71023.1 hypothetical protein H696_01969 [Fonticula alba]|eukprot:XP_009494146.1 hypothetical protein H696_01969 [Fonticula alba]